MPIRPPSLHSHYPACGGSQTTAPRSDALMPGHLHHACPRCGCKDLQVQAANPAQVLLAWVRKPCGCNDNVRGINTEIASFHVQLHPGESV